MKRATLDVHLIPSVLALPQASTKHSLANHLFTSRGSFVFVVKTDESCSFGGVSDR